MNITRLVHPGFWFGKTDKEEALQLARMGVGGFCLYGGTRAEVAALTQALRAASPLKRILISADYEDGLGRWLPDAELLPSNLALGAADDAQLAFEKGLLTARQAKSIGVDWVFAPVLDLADTPNNPIVNTRAFSANGQDTARLARAFTNGLTQGGVLNCIKHFPGHGQTETDSHLALPVLNRSLDQLKQHELIPFVQLLPFTHGVMTGHLLLPQIDPQNPASFSPAIQTGLLKNQLGWKGCVLTDALLMRAIGDEKQAALKALQAGSHILLAMNDPQALIQFLHQQTLPQDLLQTATGQLDRLCQQADLLSANARGNLSTLTSFNLRAAHAACVQQGECHISPQARVKLLALGDDEKRGFAPFEQTLRQAGITLVQERADVLVILSLSNYKSFKGHINLSEEELSLARVETRKHPKSILVCLGSPFAAA